MKKRRLNESTHEIRIEKMEIITKDILARKILDYLHHKLTIEQLVGWAEQAMIDGEYEEDAFDVISDIVAQIGLADVKAFGLLWADCEKHLKKLGYEISIESRTGS
jgi:hypothetical protein